VSVPVKVCFMIDNLAHAGTERQLIQLLQRLDRQRVTPFMVLLDGHNPVSKSLEPPGVPILRLDLKRLRSLHLWRASRLYVRFLRLHKIAIVQTYFIDSSRFSLPLAWLLGIRQTIRVRPNTGYAITLENRWDRLLIPLTDCLVCNSEEAVNYWQRYGYAENKIRLIGNLLPRPSTLAAKVYDPAQPVIGVVANLRPIKNLQEFLQAAALVLTNFANVKFEIAGTGPELESLVNLVQELGIEKAVTFHGIVNDIPKFLQGIDLAILPSLAESQSNALLEYLASGKAVIATDVGMNRFWIERTAGVIISSGNRVTISREIVRFLENPEEILVTGLTAISKYSNIDGGDQSLEDWHYLLTKAF
jgi:L-malate glycosyltransferase